MTNTKTKQTTSAGDGGLRASQHLLKRQRERMARALRKRRRSKSHQ